MARTTHHATLPRISQIAYGQLQRAGEFIQRTLPGIRSHELSPSILCLRHLREQKFGSRYAKVLVNNTFLFKLLQHIIQPINVFFSADEVGRVVSKVACPNTNCDSSLAKMAQELTGFFIRRKPLIVCERRGVCEQCPRTTSGPPILVGVKKQFV